MKTKNEAPDETVLGVTLAVPVHLREHYEKAEGRGPAGIKNHVLVENKADRVATALLNLPRPADRSADQDKQHAAQRQLLLERHERELILLLEHDYRLSEAQRSFVNAETAAKNLVHARKRYTCPICGCYDTRGGEVKSRATPGYDIWPAPNFHSCERCYQTAVALFAQADARVPNTRSRSEAVRGELAKIADLNRPSQ